MARLVCKKYQLAFSPSHWVYAYGLDCNDALWVWFNRGQKIVGVQPGGPGKYLGVGGTPGVCCLYPGTAGVVGRNFYQAMAVWMYAGEGVHQLLYRKYGYRIVLPPALPCAGCGVATGCCANGLPLSLHASFSSGDAAALTWDAANGWWAGSTPVAGGTGTIDLELACGAGGSDCTNFTLRGSGCNTFFLIADAGCSCSPLSLTFPDASLLPCGGADDVSITVTE